jgi:hypothetical protein
MGDYSEGLDPAENPDPHGALSEPEPGEIKKILKRSAEIAANLETDWDPEDPSDEL